MSEFEERMAALRARFIERARHDHQALGEALSAQDLAAIRHVAHGLSGIAGMFGHEAIGTAAATVEDLAEAPPETADAASLDKAVRSLLTLLDQVA